MMKSKRTRPAKTRSTKRKRLDLAIIEKGLLQNRSKAKALIMAGHVLVNGELETKAGAFVSENDHIILNIKDIPYVSRGGLKLEAALRGYLLNPTGLTCLDVGASTGGFTDCLLKNGAKHVFAVDVGYGQLAWKLRTDNRVTVIERTNIRYMEKNALPFPVDLATIDVSFISLEIVVPAVLRFLKKKAKIIALIKPQFEVGKGKVGKGGVVRDTALHQEVIEKRLKFFNGMGLLNEPVIPSPIPGPKGNREFFVLLKN